MIPSSQDTISIGNVIVNMTIILSIFKYLSIFSNIKVYFWADFILSGFKYDIL